MSDPLPQELISKIFTRLPIESLIQCASVCKHWLSIITSPAFVSTHLSLSRQNPLLLTAPTTTSHHNPNTFHLHFDADSPIRRLSQTLHCPFPTRGNGRFRVLGSVDGLVLLSDDLLGHTYSTILWNPSIRKSVTLPDPRFNCAEEVGPYTSMLGFGVDSVSGDYKVVRVAYVSDPEDFHYKLPPLAEVFSLRDRSWRTVSSTNVDYLYLLPDTSRGQCFINNAVHWIGRRFRGRIERGMGILLFDFGKEEFKKMALPEDEDVERPLDYYISVMGGLLSVFVGNVDWNTRGASYVNIWVKRGYSADSWTKVVSSVCFELAPLLPLRRVCRGGDAGDRRDIQVCRLPHDSFVFSYTESLVLLDGGRAVQQVG